MKRRSFICEICLLSAAPLLLLPRKAAAFSPTQLARFGNASLPAAGGSCPDDGSPSAENDASTPGLYWGGGLRYVGQARWTDGGTSRTICKLGFKLSGTTGASSYTFKAYIFDHATSPNYDIVTPAVAESNGVTGVDGWSSTWVYFTFPTPFATTASAYYALCVGATTAMPSNDMGSFSSGTALTGYRDSFSAAGAANYGGGDDLGIKIYWQ